jgi:hypothetical protein
VPQEWPAIPEHHGDVEDEMVKILQILWHAGLASLFDQQLVEAGSRWVDGEWIRLSPGNFRVRYSSYSLSRVISGGIVLDMAHIVIGFHRPSRDGQ